MKTQKLIIILLLSGVVACKKSTDNNARCNITSVVQTATTGNQKFTITYNDEGKVATIDQTLASPTHKDFSYNGNTLYVVSLDKDGKFSQKDSIALDSKGRPLYIRTFYNTDGTAWANTAFEYNGNDLLKQVQTDQAGAITGTTTFTYSNGNPVTLSYGNNSSLLEYYTDKKVQKGDYLELASLLQYGVSIYPHKNLVKMLATGGTIVNFTYELNSDGLISKITHTDGTNVGILNYTYECK